MMRELFPHQSKALAQVRGQSRIALFMQMRLGKCAVTIRWAQKLCPRGRILIVGPLSALDDWHQELIIEDIEPRKIIHLESMPRRKRSELAYGGSGWYLINYDGIRVSRELAELPWDVLVLDESTHIRNPKAQITKTLVRDYTQVEHRAILSGDPAPESPMNFFPQMQFLHGNFMGFDNYWVFRNARFQQSRFNQWDWTPKPGVRDEIKAYVRQHAVVMTRKQWGVGGRKIYERRVVEQTPAQKQAYREVFRNFSYEYIQTNFAVVRDLWLARIAGGFSPDQENPKLLSNAKTLEILDLLNGELKKEPVVIWFRFIEELKHVVKSLKKRGIPIVGITGATPQTERATLRQRFNIGQYRVLCVQQHVGRFSLNLSHASTAIYYSNEYSLETRNQSEDRIVHPTTKHDLLLLDLVTRDSLDEEAVRLLKEKRRSSAAFMREMNVRVWHDYWKHHAREAKTKKAQAATEPQRPFRIFPADDSRMRE